MVKIIRERRGSGAHDPLADPAPRRGRPEGPGGALGLKITLALGPTKWAFARVTFFNPSHRRVRVRIT
jgi:hypothetical protein